MKVLHISSSTSGGAGIAAQNLVEAERKSGIDAYLLTRNYSVQHFAMTARGSLFTRLMSSANTLFSSLIAKKEYSQLTLGSVGMIDERNVSNLNPDVIHIHNWFNILSWKQITKLNADYPLVFTLHDSRLFTGGCHFDLSCGQFVTGCGSCPAISGPKKIVSVSKTHGDKYIHKLERYAVLSPSHWLLNLGQQSKFIQGADQVQQIHNIVRIKTTISKVQSKNKKRKVYFIAANPTAPVKGLKLLLEALDQEFCEKFNLLVVVIGNTNSHLITATKSLPHVVVSGERNNHDVMTDATIGDFLIVPSISENSPNVISEAQLIGLVVVAAAVGGIPELINDGETGFLFERSIASLRNAVVRAIADDAGSIREKALKIATNRNNSGEIVEKHIQIYKAFGK